MLQAVGGVNLGRKRTPVRSDPGSFRRAASHFRPHPTARHHRQPLEPGDQIRSPQVRVAIHRQADGRVPGERLGDLGRAVGRDKISKVQLAQECAGVEKERTC